MERRPKNRNLALMALGSLAAIGVGLVAVYGPK